jgi:hypothetical protein
MILRSLLFLALFCFAAGCKTKPSASVHRGDGPTIRYFDKPEAAGGAIQRTTYR